MLKKKRIRPSFRNRSPDSPQFRNRSPDSPQFRNRSPDSPQFRNRSPRLPVLEHRQSPPRPANLPNLAGSATRNCPGRPSEPSRSGDHLRKPDDSRPGGHLRLRRSVASRSTVGEDRRSSIIPVQPFRLCEGGGAAYVEDACSGGRLNAVNGVPGCRFYVKIRD